MIRCMLFASILSLLLVAMSPVCGEAAVIEDLRPEPFRFHFSPNGDGIADTLGIEYALADTATSVHLLILEKDAVTVVDTLVGGLSQLPDIAYRAQWAGSYRDGSPVPEDSFVVFLRAVNAQEADSTSFIVTVDVTPPRVTITDLFPNPFAPKSPGGFPKMLTVEADINDPPPSNEVTVNLEVIDPNQNQVVLVADTLVAAMGTFVHRWDGGAAVDGPHELRVFVSDKAGNIGFAFALFDLDNASPTVTFTDPPTGQDWQVIPDSLFFWVWDRNGIDSVQIRYDPSETYQRIAPSGMSADTLLFSEPLASRLPTSKTDYTVQVKAIDHFSFDRINNFGATLDTLPPNTPVLDPPPPVVRTPTYLLTGTVPSAASVLRIYRNESLVDTAFTAQGGLPYELALVKGQNRVFITAADGLGNTSPPSNQIVINYEDQSGLFIGQPFHPEDEFIINVSRAASSATLRIYDLGGNLVQVLTQVEASTSIRIPWNGLNGDGDEVNKGPLVAVAVAEFSDGSTEIFREVFLLEP